VAVGNTLYTGIEGGDIVSYDLSGGMDRKWRFLTRITPKEGCKRLSDEEKCGRVVGIALDEQKR